MRLCQLRILRGLWKTGTRTSKGDQADEKLGGKGSKRDILREWRCLACTGEDAEKFMIFNYLMGCPVGGSLLFREEACCSERES